MALSFVGANVSATTTVTIPAHAVGDLIVIFAYEDGLTTVPTQPGAGGTVPTWTTIDAATGANANSSRTAQTVATATNHTSGTWTGATGMVAVVLRGQHASPIGGHGESGGSVTGPTGFASPSITMSVTTGSSLLLYFYGSRNVTAWDAAPAGYTRQASNATEVALNTKDTTTSDGVATQTATTSALGGYRSAVVEILAAASTTDPGQFFLMF